MNHARGMRSHLLPHRTERGAVLAWNQRQVQKLSPAEIWLFIIGRGLVALGVGIVAALYFPDLSRAAALPLIIVGLLCLVLASRGFFRRQQG
jgi:hypothetical protein